LAVQNGAEGLCQPVTLLGRGPALNCTWPHDYRAQSAADQFKQLAEHFETCVGGQHAPQTPVNHPDSFRQILFSGDGVWISLTMKDKAGLVQTLVSLTIAGD
jgi:hypothetical protein